MRQYELAIRIAQVHHLVDERKYKKALAVIQTLDVRQVRALSDLRVFAEVYTKTEQYDAAKATYLRVYRRSHTKRVLYRLIYLSIRTNALNDAEAYYQEFVRMSPNVRDALILRYRIDKASGAPIGQLIDILQQLKQEEYIEEWAYELAKLYHRAGREDECTEECQDIILWFGTGEIVERARILIDHLEEKDAGLYFDDKDFTVPKKEEPNPEDTGSLPDLNEFIKERKAHKKEERREGRNVAEGKEKRHFEERKEKEPEHLSEAEGKRRENKKEVSPDVDGFIDDYEDDNFDEDMDLPQMAKDGIHKLSGLLKLGKKDETGSDDAAPVQEKKVQEKNKKEEPSELEKKAGEDERKIGFMPHSQSGMGITQDLAKEIAAIYEMEQKEQQLKEKAVTVIHDTSNLATNVVERMTQAVQKNIGKAYIPIDIEEIQPEEENSHVAAEAEKWTEEQTNEETLPEDTQEVYMPENMSDELPLEDTQEVYVEENVPEELPIENAQEVYVEENAPEELPIENAPEVYMQEDVVDALPPEDTQEVYIQETYNVSDEDKSINEAKSEEERRERELTRMLEQEVADIQKGLDEQNFIENTRQDTETLKNLLQEEIVEPESAAATEPHGVLEGYQAPDIPVVETSYMEMPEITFEELPTTRALQQSFKNVLKLIAGELDPSHFVLMGDGKERIVGVTKQIVRVMKETGYLSQGRIAKIHASQINTMDLISFRSQLKGNCLLIEGASDLLFPTITRLFSIMEEYYGDFMVVLVDEGTTLDQLFRFVPALAKRFKYIIDISHYTPEDYM